MKGEAKFPRSPSQYEFDACAHIRASWFISVENRSLVVDSRKADQMTLRASWWLRLWCLWCLYWRARGEFNRVHKNLDNSEKYVQLDSLCKGNRVTLPNCLNYPP